VPGTQAPDTLEELRRRGDGVPVILGPPDTFERVVEQMHARMHRGRRSRPERLVAAAREIDAEALLQRWETAVLRGWDAEPEYNVGPPQVVLPEVPVQHGLAGHLDLRTRQPHPEVLLTVLPAEAPWMAPCFLRIGGWNAMPPAQEHAAIFRYWGQKYGAVVATLALDVVELTVAHPPATDAEALALALQQMVYCYEGDTSPGGLLERAAELREASTWYFWWD
jgi:hypothetical protein